VLQHRWLILFDRDHIIAAAVDDLFTEIPLAKQSISRDDLATHGQHAQQLQCRFVLVGLGIDPELSDHGANARRIGGQQVDAGYLVAGAATQGLTIQGDGIAQIGTALLEPFGQDFLIGAGVEPAEHIGEGRFTRRGPMREAECFGQFRAVIAGELGDGFQGLHARQQGDRRQVEDG
jgi:hypothetical protein